MRPLRSSRFMIFFALPPASDAQTRDRFLLCKSGTGLVGHEIGLIYRPIPDYLAGYGAAADAFSVHEHPFADHFPVDVPSSIWWPFPGQASVCIHGHFDPRDSRLTVETQKTGPADGRQIFSGLSSLRPTRVFLP